MERKRSRSPRSRHSNSETVSSRTNVRSERSERNERNDSKRSSSSSSSSSHQRHSSDRDSKDQKTSDRHPRRRRDEDNALRDEDYEWGKKAPADRSPKRRKTNSPLESDRRKSSPKLQQNSPNDEEAEEREEKSKVKPNFKTTGLLKKDSATGPDLKFSEPPDACRPTKRWRLYPFKGDQTIDPIPLHQQSCYLFGRDRTLADIPIDNTSCSKQHAVLQFRSIPNDEGVRVVKPYLMDLKSTNGTFINEDRIKDSRYYELKERDVLKFGFSTREYVLLHEDSAAS